MTTGLTESPAGLDYGTPPHIDPEDASNLEPTEETKYAINTPHQALSVATQLRKDWEKGIKNQASITAQLNGQRPRDPAILRQLQRNWLPNVNTGQLRIEAGKVPARLWQPINTATYLTAAKLPDNWPLGMRKTALFRHKVTQAIRSWRKWPWFMRQLSREAGVFGFGFAVWFDEIDWIPTFVRQDRGFVPAGWEILDDELPLFMVQYDYQPADLIKMVKDQENAKIEGGWDKDAVVKAINSAGPKGRESEDYRKWEELVRQASVGWSYQKNYNRIETYHLFSVDADGSVSHHVILSKDLGTFLKNGQPKDESGEFQYLFERRKEFEKMDRVVTIMMFDPDDGTVHGSWGAGQMLFDMSIEAEKTINDWIAALKQGAKVKAQAGEGKNTDEVRLKVDDTLMILENGTYAGNNAALTTDPQPYQALLEGLSQLAREKVGSYIPPIPLQPSDIKAAQINAKREEQQEVQQQIFQTWLWQFANLIENIVWRLMKPSSTDKIAKKLQEELQRNLSRKEIDFLVDQNQIETIFEFTEIGRQQKAAFAAAKKDNPFYNQKTLERIQAEAVGGPSFAEAVLIPGDDETVARGARRVQQLETAAMVGTGEFVEVLPQDLDWYHMLELRPKLEEVLTEGVFNIGIILLNHYRAHYIGAVSKQAIPKDKINVEKSFMAKADKTIQTGQLPPDGFQERIDPIEEAQAMMSGRSPTTRGPTEPEEGPREIEPEEEVMEEV